MADDINKVLQVGRLTRDAELAYTNSGYALCKFSIAVNRRRKQGEQWVDEAHYFDIQLWGRRGEGLHPYLAKGTQVAIEGALRQERWEQDGLKRSRVTIEAINVQLLGAIGMVPGIAGPRGAPSGSELAAAGTGEPGKEAPGAETGGI